MRFGEVALAEAEGAILAHSRKLAKQTFKKGRVLSAADVQALGEAGVATVIAARLDAEDVAEDEAARLVAEAVAGPGLRVAAPFTGRVNLFAEEHGLVVLDQGRLDRMNLVDEAVTVATLPAFAVVEPRQMVATIKIIPFAAPRAVVETCVALARSGAPVLRVAPFRSTAVALVQTRTAGMKESVLDKTVAVTRERLAALGSTLAGETRCAHDAGELARELREAVANGAGLVLAAGASAIVDRRDVIPSGIVAAGGRVDHFGMPVDPGNLMLLGHLDAVPVLGLPGCARSPKVNGFDWVLQRLLAGLAIGPEDIMRMGAGGLLAEIPTRPLPREEGGKTALPRAPQVAALILAAGQSRRMGALNKLLVEIEGKAMVRHVVDAVLAAALSPVTVVLGHEAERVRAALAGAGVGFAVNPDFAGGLSTSLRTGLAALPETVDGALVCLGDMPLVAPADIERLLAAFNPAEGRAIVVPTRRGKRGNPVLWARRLFAEMREVAGDTGAKHLIGAYPELVAEVEMPGEAVLVDIDTPQALADLARRRSRAPAE
jgi:molybdenum cofactor cytidylyltransferase